MPLFLDLHKAADYEAKPTVDEIKKNHIADLATQKKYGVRFIQYWINEEDGMVFCLMEGPDKEACAAVHREAHGAMPCNVIELKGGDYQTYMGESGKVNEFDIVERPDGTFDSGSRVFIAVDVLTGTEEPVLKTIRNAFKNFHGREINYPGDRLMAVFDSSEQAMQCAGYILQALGKFEDTEAHIGINEGHPVTEKESFFDLAIRHTQRLCDAAGSGRIFISPGVREMSGGSFENHDQYAVKALTPPEEKFLNSLFDIIDTAIGEPDFNIEAICKNVGISRAQLYRKVTSITGMSPNNFVKELRLRKAMRMIRRKYGNVAEVAYETGFSNPSYFSTVFQKRFGRLPSGLTT